MAILHKTTLTPTKMELLSGWLPSRPWYQGTGAAPEVVKAGAFRLDDPAGEVGIEFYVGRCGEVAYHAPMTYRAAPLDGAEDALIGTMEHGVLGRRWVYDATRDPVFADRVAALLRGDAGPASGSVSDAPDPTVLVSPLDGAAGAAEGFTASDDADGTIVRIGAMAVRVHRVLVPVAGEAVSPGQVSATWRLPGDTQARGIFLSAGPAPS